jgi:transposase
MSRQYGRIEGGLRLTTSQPYHRGSKYSIISAISQKEIIAAVYGSGSVDGDFFVYFMEHFLCPKLRNEDCVIMDNVAFHKVSKVKEMVEARGAELIYLPPYSPELSPIENMWGKLKTGLRALSARCENTFKSAVTKSLESIRQSDLLSWYKHCGYSDQILVEPL